MIKLAVIGHLGKDCTVNQVNGKNVINFSIAHTDNWTDQSGVKQSKTIWVECAYWSDSKISQYLKKGGQVYVEGIPEVRQWSTQDGKSGASLSCRVGIVQLLGGKPDDGQPQQQNQIQTQTQQTSNNQQGFKQVNTGGGRLPF